MASKCLRKPVKRCSLCQALVACLTHWRGQQLCVDCLEDQTESSVVDFIEKGAAVAS